MKYILKNMIFKSGKSQWQLCQELSWPEAKLSRFVTGRRTPKTDDLEALAQALRVSRKELEDTLINSAKDLQMNQDLLTVEELADVLRVPKSWIYSRTRIKAPGAIPRINIGKYRRFILSDVLSWLKEQQSQNG